MASVHDHLAAPAPNAPVEGALMLRHAFAEANGARVHYVTGGEGPAIVLLHGYPYTWAVWRPLLPLLVEAGYTVIAPDLRGLGFSERTEGGYDKVTVAEDVRAVVRGAGHDAVRLVGADIGAMVAYAYASRHPGEVGGSSSRSRSSPASGWRS